MRGSRGVKIQNKKFCGVWNSAETFGFPASPSARSYNKRVSASLTKFAYRRTSDTRRPLYVIRKPAFQGKETANYDDVVAFV